MGTECTGFLGLDLAEGDSGKFAAVEEGVRRSSVRWELSYESWCLKRMPVPAGRRVSHHAETYAKGP